MKKHGTNTSYIAGCRCAQCKDAHATRARQYRLRKTNGEVIPQFRYDEPQESTPLPAETPPGQVEKAVEAELSGLAVSRPALAAIALAMARILDNPRAKSTQAPAAKVLVNVLEALHKSSAQERRGNLAVVKSMTAKDGA